MQRRKFLQTTSVGLLTLAAGLPAVSCAAPASRVLVTEVLSFFRQLVVGVGATVISNRLEDWIAGGLAEQQLARDALTMMGTMGGFSSRPDSSVYAINVGAGNLNVVVATTPDQRDACFGMINTSTDAVGMLEGPAVVGLALVVDTLKSHSANASLPSKAYADFVLPVCVVDSQWGFKFEQSGTASYETSSGHADLRYDYQGGRNGKFAMDITDARGTKVMTNSGYEIT